MRRIALTLALLAAACDEPRAAAPAASASAATATSAAAAQGAGTISTSSKVPVAVAAFDRGIELAFNAHEAEAIEQFKKAVAADPKFALAYAYLGYYTQDAEGTKALETALALSPPLPESEWLLVQELQAARNGDITNARVLAERRIRVVPFDWHAHFDLAGRLYGENRYDEAAESLKKAAAFGPASYPVYNMLGYVQLKQRKFDSAVATFKRYTELKPDEPNAYDSLGEALLNAGKLEDAERAFTKAAEMKFSYAWSGVGQTRFLRGNRAGGLEALAKSRDAALNPADKLEVDALAIWATLDEPADAKKRIDELEKAAQAEKLQEPAALASLYRAVALIEAGKTEDSLRELDEADHRIEAAALPGGALTRARQSVLVWRAIAQARLGKGGDAAKTADELQGLARKSPTDPDAQSLASLGRGLAALAKGDAELAVKELSACLEDDFLCRWQLVVAQDKQGDKEGAAATRAKLTGANLRDPAYLYVHAKIAAPVSAAKAPR